MSMWTVEKAQTEEVWFQNYVEQALRTAAPKLPASTIKLGNTTGQWFENDPGSVVILTRGGGADDRRLVETMMRDQLAGFGYKQAQFVFGSMTKTADWDDIMVKAKRLVQSGQVQLLRNGPTNAIASIQGDNGTYQSELSRDDPSSQTITQWQCECPWDQYAFQRTRQWKKYEGRPCAHVLALHWASQSAPVDQDADASQGTLFDPGTAQPRTGPGNIKPPKPTGPSQPAIPGMEPGTATGQPSTGAPFPSGLPSTPGVLPPFIDPNDPANVPAVSVPGLKQPTPANPVQYPGGTFSKVANEWDFEGLKVGAQQYNNGDMVQLKQDEWGTMEGKSEAHGAGQPKMVPKGSIGEVLSQDPTLGWVDVIFAGPQKDAGPLEPYHVQMYVEPGLLAPRPDVAKPGPFIRRKR